VAHGATCFRLEGGEAKSLSLCGRNGIPCEGPSLGLIAGILTSSKTLSYLF
jgi:hypothetical protein